MELGVVTVIFVVRVIVLDKVLTTSTSYPTISALIGSSSELLATLIMTY